VTRGLNLDVEQARNVVAHIDAAEVRSIIQEASEIKDPVFLVHLYNELRSQRPRDAEKLFDAFVVLLNAAKMGEVS
jgi:hypothetical protein